MAGPVSDPLDRPMRGPLAGALARVTEAAWEARRGAYARGWFVPERVGARVVSIGNLSVGGAGKTTLVLHLAAQARARGEEVAVVTRRYRPGPAGHGDEELLYRAAVGASATFAGTKKLDEARRAAGQGARLVLVDDGFSHWPLERDLDLVLLDRTDLWGGGRLLPAGTLREPIRALQRAQVVVVTRLEAGEDPAPLLDEVRRRAPAALLAAARHEPAGVRDLDGREVPAAGPARVLTATGNPRAVEASAREAGFSPVTLAAYRDHHWFTPEEAAREHAAAAGGLLLLTAKDAVRWPAGAPRERVGVLGTRWAWVVGGEAVERRVSGEDA